jgi:hypothetical protein
VGRSHSPRSERKQMKLCPALLAPYGYNHRTHFLVGFISLPKMRLHHRICLYLIVCLVAYASVLTHSLKIKKFGFHSSMRAVGSPA